jgi:hypothetical protein
MGYSHHFTIDRYLRSILVKAVTDDEIYAVIEDYYFSLSKILKPLLAQDLLSRCGISSSNSE